MNPCLQAIGRPYAARHAGIVFWKDPPWRFREVTRRLWRLFPLVLVILTPQLSRAQQTNGDAVSREISLFNLGQPTARAEAISREVSLFNLGQPTASYEAISREVSVFDFGQPTAQNGSEAISREVSIFDRGFNTLDTISREVSVFYFGPQSSATNGYEAISREFSEYNYGYNRLSLTVGSTVVLAGSNGRMPVTFSTIAPVTNVQLAVNVPGTRLTNWTVQTQPPLIGTAVVSNNSVLLVTFSPTNGLGITNTQQLGQVAFVAVSNQPSAFLPLPIASAAAAQSDGTTATPYKTLQNGEVVVLNSNSLMRAYRGANGLEYLTLYGLPGTSYSILSATNLSPPVNWQTAYSGLMTSNLFYVTPGLGRTNPVVFYRAVQ